MIYRLIYSLLLIVFSTFSCFSQQVNEVANTSFSIENACLDKSNEMVYIHLCSATAKAGERIFFKAYIIGKEKSVNVNSKVLYFQVIDYKGVVKFSSRSEIENNISQSSFVVPDSLASGLYKLVAYTNYMHNIPASAYYHTPLLIVGQKYEPEFTKTEHADNKIVADSLENTIDTIKTEVSGQLSTEDSNIKVWLNKNSFKCGEKVSLTLQLNSLANKIQIGNFSISITEKIPNGIEVNQLPINQVVESFKSSSPSGMNNNIDLQKVRDAYTNWINQYKSTDVRQLRYKPENTTYMLEGTAYNKVTQIPLTGEKVLLASPDSLATLLYCFTDSLGRFKFSLDNTFDNRKLMLSMYFEKEPKEYYFSIDSKLLADSTLSFSPLKSDKILIDYIFKCKELAIFNKIYSRDIAKNTLNISQNKAFRFYGQPDFRVFMSDYLVEFEDFNDIVKNTLPAVRFKKKNKKRTLQLVDLNQHNAWNENCLILLNNVPFNDIEYISTLGSKQIKYIEVNFRHIAYGDIDFYGIISIFTNENIVISNSQTTILENKVEPQYRETIAAVSQSKKSKLPSFKQVLYWNPNLLLTSSKAEEIEFNTSDLATDYIINIQGITSDGKPFSKSTEFKVR